MKYKVGDIVKVIEYEYNPELIREYFKKNPDRILTIREVSRLGDNYLMEELRYWWDIIAIECLIEEVVLYPIKSRFEILDFGEK